MKHKLKFGFCVLVTVIAAQIFVADFAMAQTPAPTPAPAATGLSVTKDDIVAIDSAVDNLSKHLNDSDFIAQRDGVMRQCRALGDKVLQISSGGGAGHYGKISTLWVENPPPGKCVFGRWNRATGGTDTIARVLGRKDDVSVDVDPSLIQLWTSIKGGTATFNTAFVDADNAKYSKPDGTDVVTSVIAWILEKIFDILTSVVLAFSSIAGLMLVYSVQHNFETLTQGVNIIGRAWGIVRDFMNMFFILALITIAIGTILRLDKYDYKKLLVRLVLMALLINFSRVIAETLIGFSDLLMDMFVRQSNFSSYGQAFSGLVTNGQGVLALGSDGIFGALAVGIGKLIVAVLMMVSFFAVALLLFIRIIGLQILVILSPVAYALSILPDTKKYAQQWWTTFIKYLIWGPVSIFFLYLAEYIIQIKGGSSGSNTGNAPLDYILIAAFMWAAVVVAKQAGMVGAGTVLNYSEKYAKKLGGYTGSYVARGNFLSKDVGAGAVASYFNFNKLADRMDKTGKGIGTMTAKPQAYVKAVGESLDRANAARKYQISKMVADMQVDGALFVSKIKPEDEENAKKIKGRHVSKIMKSDDVNLSQIASLAAYGGRDVGDALMMGLQDGLLDEVKRKKPDDYEAMKKAIYKNFFTSRNVKEIDYMAAEEKYLEQKIDIGRVGALKEGEIWSEYKKNDAGKFVDKNNNELPDTNTNDRVEIEGTGVKGQKERWDNRRPTVNMKQVRDAVKKYNESSTPGKEVASDSLEGQNKSGVGSDSGAQSEARKAAAEKREAEQPIIPPPAAPNNNNP